MKSLSNQIFAALHESGPVHMAGIFAAAAIAAAVYAVEPLVVERP